MIFARLPGLQTVGVVMVSAVSLPVGCFEVARGQGKSKTRSDQSIESSMSKPHGSRLLLAMAEVLMSLLRCQIFK